MRCNRVYITIFITLTIILYSPLTIMSQDESMDDSKVRLGETEIKGKLPEDFLHLKETEITGSIRYPKVTSELPWRDPRFLEDETSVLKRSFLKEIYTPLDRDRFIWELGQRERMMKDLE